MFINHQTLCETIISNGERLKRQMIEENRKKISEILARAKNAEKEAVENAKKEMEDYRKIPIWKR